MWAIVPLKSPHHAKTRLSDTFSPIQRERLLYELGKRVIDALQAADGIDAVAVVTSSPTVADFARSLGAEPLLQKEDRGTASAFAAAVHALQPAQMQSVLMIAGDLPLITAAAIEHLIASRDAASAIVVPDRHLVGTNALLCTPPQSLTPCFGVDSLHRHLATAKRTGISSRVLEIEELALDLDCATDLRLLRYRNHAAAMSLCDSLQNGSAASVMSYESKVLAGTHR